MRWYIRVTGLLFAGAVAMPALADLAVAFIPLFATLFGTGLVMAWVFGRRSPW